MLTGTTFTYSIVSLALIMALLTSLIALPFQMIGLVVICVIISFLHPLAQVLLQQARISYLHRIKQQKLLLQYGYNNPFFASQIFYHRSYQSKKSMHMEAQFLGDS